MKDGDKMIVLGMAFVFLGTLYGIFFIVVMIAEHGWSILLG